MSAVASRFLKVTARDEMMSWVGRIDNAMLLVLLVVVGNNESVVASQSVMALKPSDSNCGD